MSDPSTQPRSNTSPLASFVAFAVIMLLTASGFAVWKYIAQHKALNTADNPKPGAYKIDPDTGRLTEADSGPGSIWPKEGVADFRLIDQTGQVVSKADLLGKPWAVCFVFTRCAGQCLEIMAGMHAIAEELKDADVRLVTISVEPEYDTPEVLAHYAEGFGADANRWKFLTGEQDQIYRLIQKSFLLPVQEVTGPDRKEGFQVVHTPDILHINAQGHVVGKYNGMKEQDRKKLVEAMKREAAELEAQTGFELTERSGRTVTNEDLLGQPWAVNFVFTRCAGQCLQITANMANLQSELEGAPVRLVTITVDPKYDTPEVLQNYADGVGADPDRWLFLTGDQEYVYQLLYGYFRQIVHEFTGEERKKGYEVFHTSDVLHMDAKGNIVKTYNGMNAADMTRLRKALLAEAERLARANEGETASLLEPALAEKQDSGGRE